MRYLLAYIVALVIFAVLDFLWLGVIAKESYARRMGDLLRDQPLWAAAVAFYLLYMIGLVYFAIAGHLQAGDWKLAARDGAFFGFFTYLTYGLTNLAVLKGYDTGLTIVDIAWGAVIGAVAAGGTVLLLSAFRG